MPQIIQADSRSCERLCGAWLGRQSVELTFFLQTVVKLKAPLSIELKCSNEGRVLLKIIPVTKSVQRLVFMILGASFILSIGTSLDQRSEVCALWRTET